MTINELKIRISPILEQYNAEYVAIFGSFARGEASSDSDVDFLIRLQRPVGFFKLNALQQSLEKELQRPVDLVEEEGLSKHIKPFIIKDLVTIYEK